MKIECTKDEIQQLAGLLDLATKAGGLQVAPLTVQWAAKIEQAVNEDQPDETLVDFKQAKQ